MMLPLELFDPRVYFSDGCIIAMAQPLDVCGLMKRFEASLAHTMKDRLDNGSWRCPRRFLNGATSRAFLALVGRSAGMTKSRCEAWNRSAYVARERRLDGRGGGMQANLRLSTRLFRGDQSPTDIGSYRVYRDLP
jgi:hypothetical protein